MRNSLRSISGGAAARLTVLNETQQDLRVAWIDSSGLQREYAALKADGQYHLDSFVGHAWMITDADSTCLAALVLTDDGGTAISAAR